MFELAKAITKHYRLIENTYYMKLGRGGKIRYTTSTSQTNIADTTRPHTWDFDLCINFQHILLKTSLKKLQ